MESDVFDFFKPSFKRLLSESLSSYRPHNPTFSRYTKREDGSQLTPGTNFKGDFQDLLYGCLTGSYIPDIWREFHDDILQLASSHSLNHLTSSNIYILAVHSISEYIYRFRTVELVPEYEHEILGLIRSAVLNLPISVKISSYFTGPQFQQEIYLNSHATVRSLGDDEIQYAVMKNSDKIFEQYIGPKIWDANCVLDLTYTGFNAFGSFEKLNSLHKVYSKELEDISEKLSVFFTYSPCINYRTVITAASPTEYYEHASILSQSPHAPFKSKEKFDHSLEDKLKIFISKKIPKRLKIAMDRSRISKGRARIEDKILDDVIVLESLFGDDNESLVYKLRLRAAYCSSSDPREIKHNFSMLGKVYSKRSKLVHEGSGIVDEESRELHVRYAKFTSTLLKQMLFRYLDDQPMPLGGDVDDYIFRSESGIYPTGAI